MLCARQCPDWCIYIEGHKEQRPPRREGGRPRTVSVLDRFDIDYALCMYCGICVEVCPFDALFWSPEFEYSELQIAELLHDKVKLGEWMETVPSPSRSRSAPRQGQEEVAADAGRRSRHRLLASSRSRWSVGRDRRRHAPSNVVHAALFLVVVLAGAAAQYILLAAEFVAWVQVLVYIGAIVVLFLFGIMLTRAPMHAEADARQRPALAGRGRRAVPPRASSAACSCNAFGGKKIHLTRAGRSAPADVGERRSSASTSSRSRSSRVLLLAALVGAVVLARRD